MDAFQASTDHHAKQHGFVWHAVALSAAQPSKQCSLGAHAGQQDGRHKQAVTHHSLSCPPLSRFRCESINPRQRPCSCAGGVLQGEYIELAAVKKLESMPTRAELMQKIGRLIRKVTVCPLLSGSLRFISVMQQPTSCRSVRHDCIAMCCVHVYQCKTYTARARTASQGLFLWWSSLRCHLYADKHSFLIFNFV